MSTNFPTSLDSLSNPSASSTLAAANHHTIETNQNDAITALETKVGADSSAVSTSHDYKLTKVLVDHDANGKHKINVLDAERYATDAAGSDTYVVTLSPVPSAYAAGMVINFIPGTSNTGACTINVNSLGAKNIKWHDIDPVDNMIVATFPAQLIYNGTNFELLNPATRLLGSASVTANQGTFTTTTDLTSLTKTVTIPTGGAFIEVTGFANFDSSVGADVVFFSIFEGATQLQSATMIVKGGANPVTIIVKSAFSATAGSHTYKLSAGRSTGTGNITMYSGSTQPAFIEVKLI